MADEEAIKRRLLIDGDGTGDDRRINVLLKTFIKWCNANDATDNNQVMHDRMLAQLAQCEFSILKSQYGAEMMAEELKHYETVSNTIESNIKFATKEIEEGKASLQNAKKTRKNRMEYDSLAKIIHTQPDRKNTLQQLELLEKELKELQENKSNLQAKLDGRKNDFFVLMRSIQELQNEIENNTTLLGGEDNNGSGSSPENKSSKMVIDDELI